MERCAKLVPPPPAPCVGGCGRSIVGNVCPTCAERIEAAEAAKEQRHAVAAVRARMPDHAIEAMFGSPLLAAKVDPRWRAEAEALVEHARHEGWPPFTVLQGEPGQGKTLLAAAMLHAVLDHSCSDRAGLGERALARRAWWAEAQIPARARAEHPLGRGEPPELTRCEGASLLVLDDLGAETARSSGIADLVKLRAARGRPTIVTTRLTTSEVASRYRDADGEGVARRLFEAGRARVFAM